MGRSRRSGPASPSRRSGAAERSRRDLGWHRLDPRWARRLVELADLPPGALVLDVGAGEGAVTDALVDVGARVVAIEVHPQRLAHLRARYGASVRVVRADAGDLRLPRRPFHVVANPPFSTTSALLRRLVHPGSRLVSATLVLEAAAARRWAGPGAPAAARWQRQLVADLGPRVPRSAFRPPPRHAAQVLSLRRLGPPRSGHR